MGSLAFRLVVFVRLHLAPRQVALMIGASLHGRRLHCWSQCFCPLAKMGLLGCAGHIHLGVIPASLAGPLGGDFVSKVLAFFAKIAGSSQTSVQSWDLSAKAL